MADKIPQLEDTQPVITPQKVSSKAEGYEAFGKSLQSLANVAEKAVEKIETDKSNAMLLSSVANIDQLKAATQEAIAVDPANAGKHIATMQDSIDKVQKIAYVNKGDRNKLKLYAQRSYNATEVEAVKAEAKQAQLGVAYEHYKNWPNQLDALRDSLNDNDPKRFEQLRDSMMDHLKSMVLLGAITPLKAGAAMESMKNVIEISKDYHDFAATPEAHTAANYHAVMANPYNKNKTNNINYPVDENTRWMVNHYATDRTFVGVEDALQNHLMPDFKSYESLTKLQRQELKLQYNGIRKADGLIDSNAALPKINQRIAELEGRTDYSSLAEKKQLNTFVKDLLGGDSQKLMARTALGGQIVRDYTDNQSFLQNKLDNTDEKNTEEIKNIHTAMFQNKNDYVDKSIAYAEAHHWPVVHPIPKEDVAVVTNGFNIGKQPGDSFNNAQNALTIFNQYSPQNQMYLANELPNPRHRVVMQTISLGGKANTDQEKLDFISSNQTRTYKEIDLKTNDQISDDYLKNAINTQIGDAIKLIQAQNNVNDGIALSGGLILASVNYAKFMSEKNGQFTMSKDSSAVNVWGSYNNVGAVTKFVNNSYSPMSGANYIVNKNQVHLEPEQMDYVAQYAIESGHTYLRGGMDEANFISFKDQAALSVTVLPNNVLIAKDINGNIAFRQPLTGDFVSHAIIEMKKLREKNIKEHLEFFKPIEAQRKIFRRPMFRRLEEENAT